MAMRGILADINIQGHVALLRLLCESEEWNELWSSLNLAFRTLPDEGLPSRTPDSEVWRYCQRQQFVLLTANRRADTPDSLEATIRVENTPQSLPVFTFADSENFLRNKVYAERVAEKFLEKLLEIDKLRGTGRVWLP
jgi:hypothetical protein